MVTNQYMASNHVAKMLTISKRPTKDLMIQDVVNAV